jgi:ATP-dependent exoDNAse (exonuclease V) beta subunit
MNHVTDIIKAVLHPYIPAKQYHLDRGTLIHSIMRKEGLKQDYVLSDPNNEIAPYIPAMKNFWNIEKPEVIATEERLESKSHNLCGTLDLRCKRSGKVAIIDYKTNSEPWTTKYQLGGYALLAHENMLPVSKLYALEIGLGGKYHLEPYDAHMCENQFRAILTVFNILVKENQYKKEGTRE